MSLRDYELGKKVASDYNDDDFYGLIQALMRLADSDNEEKLRVAWPHVWSELKERYNAPGGLLAGEIKKGG